MKKISIISTIVALFSLASVQAQVIGENYPDTLIIETDSNNEITFAFDWIGKDKEYISNDLWKSMIGVMQSALENSDYTEGVEVSYQKIEWGEEKVKVEVSPIENVSDILLIEKDRVRQYNSDRVEFRILLSEVAIYFIINDLDELDEIKSLDVKSVWSQIRAKFKDEGERNLYEGKGKVKYGEVSVENIEAKQTNIDNIQITFIEVGLGYYRDRFVPDLGPKISFNLYDRIGNPFMEFGFLYTHQFFFNQVGEGDFDLEENGFLTGFWKRKFRKSEIGIGVSTLVQREGSFYKGDTFKFTMYTQKKDSNISFTPEIVFTNNFKDVFPVLRFGLTF